MMKINSDQLRLQPLSIPTGFEVLDNEFYDILDKGLGIMFEDFPSTSHYELYKSTLLQLLYKPSDILIDLGWGPESDPTGSFHITIIRTDDKRWVSPLVEYSSPSKEEIVTKLNELMLAIFKGEIQQGQGKFNK